MSYDEAVEAAAEAVSDTLDEYLERHHDIFTSHTNPEDFMRWLGENGHEVRATPDAPTDPASDLDVPADDASAVGEPDEQVVGAVAEYLRDEYGVYGGVAKQEARHLIAFIRDAGWQPIGEPDGQVQLLASILGDFAVADEHTGERNDEQLARLLIARGVTVARDAGWQPAPTRHVPSPAELREDLARGGTGEYTSPGYGKPAPTVAPSVEAIYAALMDSRREGRRDDTVELVTREMAEAVAAADPRESVEDAERRGAVRALREAADGGSERGFRNTVAVEWLRNSADRIEREGQR